MIKRVIGMGGIFFKCRDKAALSAWYERHLGIAMQEWGAAFPWKDETHTAAYSVLSFFKEDSEYFAPSTSPFMLNLRVADLDALLVELEKEGIEIVGTPVSDAFGKFAWILDLEGNKIELWEQGRGKV
jgi:D-3-phosphoglycerate dehydrogenase / 2-oxoglutarate reductase